MKKIILRGVYKVFCSVRQRLAVKKTLLIFLSEKNFNRIYGLYGKIRKKVPVNQIFGLDQGDAYWAGRADLH